MGKQSDQTLRSMLGYVNLWSDDARAGFLPTKGSLKAARRELLLAIGGPEPEPEEQFDGKSDTEEYREVYELGRRSEARAMREGR